MGIKFDGINISSRDHVAAGKRWAQILGLEPDGDVTDPQYVHYRIPGTEVYFVFQPPEDGETGEAFTPRIHLDAQAEDGSTRNEEVDRLLAMGMKLVVDRRTPDGAGWATLADEDGTEICVGRSDEERAAAQ